MDGMRLARTAVVTVLAAALPACTSRDGAAQRRGPYAKEVAEAVPRIEQSTGLKFKTPPVLEERSKEEVRTFLEREFAKRISPQELEGNQTAYRLFGVIPDSLELRAFMVDLLTEQVVGYYDPSAKVLYVVKGAPADQVGLVIWHELVHALQDQYMNLDSIQAIKGDNDRQVAAHAVIEGHATLEQMRMMLGPGFDMSQIPGGWERVREGIRSQSGSMPLFGAAPFVIQETLIFPYLSGAEFMRRYGAKAPGKFPIGAEIPQSTEQILHAEAYFGTARDVPTRVTLPAPKGGREAHQDNLGEFETRLVLFEHLQDQNEAVRAAAGWDGDRYMVVKTPRGDGLAWLTVWDSAVEAAEFVDALGRVVSKRYGSTLATDGAGGWRRATGRGRAVALWGGEIAGRAAALYVDVPQGASTDVIDLGRVQLRE